MCLSKRAAGLLALPVWLATGAAAQPVSGPYVSAGGGADFLQNQILAPNPMGSGELP